MSYLGISTRGAYVIIFIIIVGGDRNDEATTYCNFALAIAACGIGYPRSFFKKIVLYRRASTFQLYTKIL